MTTKKQKKILKETFKTTIKIFLGVILICLGATLLIKICVPLILNLLGMLVNLIKLYSFVDTNTKFIGGCFFLVLGWYVLTAFIQIMMALVRVGLEMLSKEFRIPK
jgi:ascorbate-specific PTS system EIIC-type component UlaA